MSAGGTILFLGVIAGAGALFATKPTKAEIERMFRDELIAEVQSAQPGDIAQFGLLWICRSNMAECTELLRAMFRVEVEDQVLWQRVTFTVGRGDPLHCLGVLNQTYCPNFLND